MQFANGTPPELVAKRDLLPEISYEKAHILIAKDMNTFMNMRLFGTKEYTTEMKRRVQASGDFFKPIIDALHYEGYHNFRPPCLCKTDTCEPQSNCTAGCPFTSSVSQPTMSSGLDGLSVNDVDSFHDVWETEPNVHLPTIQNSCSSSQGCTLNMTTITQGVCKYFFLQRLLYIKMFAFIMNPLELSALFFLFFLFFLNIIIYRSQW
jgi:hypothetical protein